MSIIIKANRNGAHRAINSLSFSLYTHTHCTKSVHIWSFSGPYIPAFALNEGKYGPVKLRIQTLFMQ